MPLLRVAIFSAALALAIPLAQAEGRLMGLAVNELPDVPYETSLNEARAFGIGYVPLSLEWDDLETGPGFFAPEPDWLAIAANYYPAVGLPFALEINPIDTVADRRPAWLQNEPWDSREVIKAYAALLEYALDKTADADLLTLTIGNEVDVLLGGDEKAWQAYGRFISEVAKTVHTLRPGLPVAVKTTFDGLGPDQRRFVQALQEQTDIVQMTYYGLEDFFAQGFAAAPPISEMVPAALQTMVDAFPGREIHLAETGFPSGTACFRGEEGQAEFIRALFSAWDDHADQITAIMWEWMHDVPLTQVNIWSDYYSVHNECFTDYLANLGLKNTDGSAKLGWETFSEEVFRRFN